MGSNEEVISNLGNDRSVVSVFYCMGYGRRRSCRYLCKKTAGNG